MKMLGITQSSGKFIPWAGTRPILTIYVLSALHVCVFRYLRLGCPERQALHHIFVTACVRFGYDGCLVSHSIVALPSGLLQHAVPSYPALK